MKLDRKMRVTRTRDGQVLDLVAADETGETLQEVLDFTPRDAGMRSLGLEPTILCHLRLGDRSISLAACARGASGAAPKASAHVLDAVTLMNSYSPSARSSAALKTIGPVAPA